MTLEIATSHVPVPAHRVSVVPYVPLNDASVTPSDLFFEGWEDEVYAKDPTGGQPSFYL